MIVVLGLVAVWAFLTVFYTLYIAAINIVRYWASLHPLVKLFCLPIVIPMLVIDAFANFTLIALLFGDLPREMMVTQRLSRYRSIAYNGSRRQDVAAWICERALNPFDPTRHHC